MDDLVASDAEEGRAEDLLRLRVDDDPHEPFRLALLARAADVRHRLGADEQLAPALARRAQRHSAPAERGVDVQGVGLDAVRDPARLTVEKVGGDDLVVVVGRVRERAAAVAVAERPDRGHARAELVVDLHVAAVVDRDARALEAEVVRVRDAAGREEEVRAGDRLRS